MGPIAVTIGATSLCSKDFDNAAGATRKVAAVTRVRSFLSLLAICGIIQFGAGCSGEPRALNKSLADLPVPQRYLIEELGDKCPPRDAEVRTRLAKIVAAEDQSFVLNGEIRHGMTPHEVLMAWGKPSAGYSEMYIGGATGTEIWRYDVHEIGEGGPGRRFIELRFVPSHGDRGGVTLRDDIGEDNWPDRGFKKCWCIPSQ